MKKIFYSVLILALAVNAFALLDGFGGKLEKGKPVAAQRAEAFMQAQTSSDEAAAAKVHNTARGLISAIDNNKEYFGDRQFLRLLDYVKAVLPLIDTEQDLDTTASFLRNSVDDQKINGAEHVIIFQADIDKALAQ